MSKVVKKGLIAAGVVAALACILFFYGVEAVGTAETKFGTLNLRWGENLNEGGEGESSATFEIRLDGEGDFSHGYTILWESAENEGNLRYGVMYYNSFHTNPFSSSSLIMTYPKSYAENIGKPLSVVIFKHPEKADSGEGIDLGKKLTDAWIEGRSVQELATLFSSEAGAGAEYESGIYIIPDQVKLKPGETRTPHYCEERKNSWYWRVKERLYRWRKGL